MKRNEYVIKSPKVKSDKNIVICSDMHINSRTSFEKIEETIGSISEMKPTHIVIPGDLYDANQYGIAKNAEKVAYFIGQTSKIADVYYVRGNIDQRINLFSNDSCYNDNEKFHALCEGNENDSQLCVKNDDINFSGIELPSDFYDLGEHDKIKILLSYYKTYLEKLSNICGSKDFNVLLCHDPIIRDAICYLSYKGIIDLNFDLVVSGHNHGGIWPTFMKPLFRLAHFDMDLLYPTYTKGMFEMKDCQKNLIVSEGVTKFHSGFGALQFLESFHEGTIENVKVLKVSNKTL